MPYLWTALFTIAGSWAIASAVWYLFRDHEQAPSDGDGFASCCWLIFIVGLVLGLIWPITIFVAFWAAVIIPIVLVINKRKKARLAAKTA